MDTIEHAGRAAPASARLIGPEGLVALLEGGLDRVLLIDSRPFVDYNTSHILEAINVNCSKLMKRRLQQDKVQIAELLQHSAKKKVSASGSRGFLKSVRRSSCNFRGRSCLKMICLQVLTGVR